MKKLKVLLLDFHR